MVPGYLGSTWVVPAYLGAPGYVPRYPGTWVKKAPNSQKDATLLLQQSFEDYTQTLGNSTHSYPTTDKIMKIMSQMVPKQTKNLPKYTKIGKWGPGGHPYREKSGFSDIPS